MEFLENKDIFIRAFLSVLLVIFVLISQKFIKAFIRKVIEKHSAKDFINSKKINTLTTFLFSTVKYLLYFFVFFAFCKILKIPVDSFLLAIAGAGGVALGLGSQTLIKNVINGFFILIEDQYSVGDLISIGNFTGTVEEIGIRTTKLRTIEGNLHIIPNGDISITTNMTRKIVPAVVDVSLPLEVGADKVLTIIKDEMEKVNKSGIDGLVAEPDILGITALGQFSFTIKILANAEQAKYLSVERELRLRLKNRLDAEKIKMSYAQSVFGGNNGV